MSRRSHTHTTEGPWSRFRPLLLCAFSASLYGLVSPDLNWHYLAWFLLVPFLSALDEAGLRRSFYLGWVCGTLTHLICFSWVIETIRVYSNLNLTLSVLGWILFSCYSGLAFGAMALAYRFLELRLAMPAVVGLPLCYTAMEYLFPFIFPWHLGAVLYRVTPVIQISDLFGVYGVTALVVLVNGACWDLVRFLQRRRAFPWVQVPLALALLSAAWAYGAWRMETLDALRTEADPYVVGLVQPDIRIEERRTRLLQEEIWHRYRTLSRQVIREGAELVVWPESAIHFAYHPMAASSSNSGTLRRLVASLQRPVLFGSWAMGPNKPTNTAFLLDAQGEYLARYDKVRLLAFGEYIPLGDRFPFIKDWIQGVGDFERGSRLEPVCHEDVCFGVLICFEAIVGGLSRELINRGARFLVNITNDVWFGDTKCPEQHLMLASLRAVENRVWMVRVANTGISACVDPYGRIVSRTPVFQQAARACSVERLDVPSLYRRWGDWFPRSCGLLLLAFSLLAGAKRPRA